MKFGFVDEHRSVWPVRVMCEALGLSASGYYAWRDRPESRRAAANQALLDDIRLIHAESSGTYGSPRIHAVLRGHGGRPGCSHVPVPNGLFCAPWGRTVRCTVLDTGISPEPAAATTRAPMWTAGPPMWLPQTSPVCTPVADGDAGYGRGVAERAGYGRAVDLSHSLA